MIGTIITITVSGVWISVLLSILAEKKAPVLVARMFVIVFALTFIWFPWLSLLIQLMHRYNMALIEAVK